MFVCPHHSQCAICLSAMATMQTLPCGHRVVCRKCFIKTIRSAIADRSLPLKCIVCRASVLKLGPTPTQRRRPAAAADAFSSVTSSSSSSTPLRSICRRRTASYTAAQTLTMTPTKTENSAHRRVQQQQQLEYVATVDDVDRLDHHWRRYEEQIPTSNLNGIVADRGDTYRTARSLVRNSAATDHNGNSYCRSVSTSGATAAGVGRINERASDWFTAGNRDSSASSRCCGSCHHHRHRLRPQTASVNAPFAQSQHQQQQQQQSRVTTSDASSADFSLQTAATLFSAGAHATAFHAGAGTPSAGAKLTLQPMPIYPAQGSAPTRRRAFFASSWSAASSSAAETDGDGAASDRSKGPSSMTDGNGRRQQVALQSGCER